MRLPPFQRLVDEHGPALYRATVALVGTQNAPDCYQDTLVAALSAYPDLNHADNLRGWLFTIARRKAMDAGRTRARRRTSPVADPPAGAAPPADTRAEADGALWAAVRALPDGQREALVYRYVADLRYADVARALECTEAAARRRVADALARLRREYP